MCVGETVRYGAKVVALRTLGDSLRQAPPLAALEGQMDFLSASGYMGALVIE